MPAAQRVEIANGRLPSGATWQLLYRHPEDILFTSLHVISSEGRTLFGGGHGCPYPLPEAMGLSAYIGREGGCTAVVIQVSRQVQRVTLEGTLGSQTDVPLFVIQDHELTMASGVVLNPAVPVTSVVAWNAAGEPIFQQPLPDLDARSRMMRA